VRVVAYLVFGVILVGLLGVLALGLFVLRWR
jgi:hypothetical protein